MWLELVRDLHVGVPATLRIHRYMAAHPACSDVVAVALLQLYGLEMFFGPAAKALDDPNWAPNARMCREITERATRGAFRQVDLADPTWVDRLR